MREEPPSSGLLAGLASGIPRDREHDLGLSHGSIYAELQKPFWRE
jgi:hypothetical protein